MRLYIEWTQACTASPDGMHSDEGAVGSVERDRQSMKASFWRWQLSWMRKAAAKSTAEVAGKGDG